MSDYTGVVTSATDSNGHAFVTSQLSALVCRAFQIPPGLIGLQQATEKANAHLQTWRAFLRGLESISEARNKKIRNARGVEARAKKKQNKVRCMWCQGLGVLRGTRCPMCKGKCVFSVKYLTRVERNK